MKKNTPGGCCCNCVKFDQADSPPSDTWGSNATVVEGKTGFETTMQIESTDLLPSGDYRVRMKIEGSATIILESDTGPLAIDVVHIASHSMTDPTTKTNPTNAYVVTLPGGKELFETTPDAKLNLSICRTDDTLTISSDTVSYFVAAWGRVQSQSISATQTGRTITIDPTGTFHVYMLRVESTGGECRECSACDFWPCTERFGEVSETWTAELITVSTGIGTGSFIATPGANSDDLPMLYSFSGNSADQLRLTLKSYTGTSAGFSNQPPTFRTPRGELYHGWYETHAPPPPKSYHYVDYYGSFSISANVNSATCGYTISASIIANHGQGDQASVRLFEVQDKNLLQWETEVVSKPDCCSEFVFWFDDATVTNIFGGGPNHSLPHLTVLGIKFRCSGYGY